MKYILMLFYHSVFVLADYFEQQQLDEAQTNSPPIKAVSLKHSIYVI